MKRLILGIVLLTTGHLSAQTTLPQMDPSPSEQALLLPGGSLKTSGSPDASDVFGDTIWTEDFSGGIPGTWANIDNTGMGNVWTSETNANLTCTYTNVTFPFSSVGNGYAVIFSDRYNSDASCLNLVSSTGMDAYIQSPAINLSGVSSVHLRFQHAFRYCCNSTASRLSVFVSNDGTNWTEFDVRGGLTANVPSANLVFESVNITSVAANQPAVYIRFHKYAASHYYWAIDDVAIVEGPADNLTLTRAKVDFNYPGGGFYSRIPVSQAAETSLGFEAMVENDGSNAQTGSSLTVEVKDGSGATRYLETGPAKAIASSTTDSLATSGSFTPGRGFGYTDVGNYTVNYTIVQDQADQVLADNVASLSYMLTDSVYARDNGVSGGNAAPDSYTCCTTDGSEIATLYEFTATETVTSVSVFVLGSTSPTGITIFGNLYGIDANNFVGAVPIAQSDLYDITTSDLGTWVTLAFTIPAVVQRDSAVLASIAVFGYDAGADIDIGAETTANQPPMTSFVYGGSWGWITAQPMIRLNTTGSGVPYTNVITGNVFEDVNSDCLPGGSDAMRKGWMVKAEPGPSYAVTNSNGFFSIKTDTGTHTVTLVSPNTLWSVNCPAGGNYQVNFPAYEDTSGEKHFTVSGIADCPYLTVNIGSTRLRACRNASYFVNYENIGTDTAFGAYVDIEFPPFITPSASIPPWTSRSGNTCRYNVGDIAPFQEGSIVITVSVSCTVVTGQAVCAEAKIFPDTICEPADSTWDRSSVAVEGTCSGDSVIRFVIHNTGDPGNGDMTAPSTYRLYENNVLIDTKPFQLSGGDSLVINVPANGNTFRLEADQRPGHPGNSRPRQTVEMCDTPAATGYALGVAEDDQDSHTAIDCREITGSYDPNDKRVSPKGITAYNYISEDDELEYHINFQNTGNDTAFLVVIRDTLSNYLDLESVRSGISSHPYVFNIYGAGILEWTFNDILLPDSNVNEPASHGFVKFHVKQKPGNAVGTLIENRAGIIFDFNDPVITNNAWNIVNDTVFTTAARPSFSPAEVTMKVFPNPLTHSATVLVGEQYQISSVRIYSISGSIVTEKRGLSGNRVSIGIENLPGGMYFIEVISEEGMQAREKVIIQ